MDSFDVIIDGAPVASGHGARDALIVDALAKGARLVCGGKRTGTVVTEDGRSSAVFGRDIIRAPAVSKRIRSGICHIDGPVVEDEVPIPSGGAKGSGCGRFGGKAVIDAPAEPRWISIEARQHNRF